MNALDFSHINPDCFGKEGFVSKKEAMDHIARRRRRKLTNGAKRLNPYRCDDCGQWHVRGQRL